MTGNETQQPSMKQVAQAVAAVLREPDADLWLRLSALFEQAGCRDEALEVARIGMGQFPRDFALALAGARLLAENQDAQEALEALEHCLNLDERNAEALWLTATLQQRLGQATKARATLERLLAIVPEHEAAREMLRTLQAEASAAATPGVPKRPITTPTLAEIYVKQGYLSKAIEVYQEILREDPDNALIRRRLGELQEAAALPAAEISGPGEQPLAVAASSGEAAVETFAPPVVEPSRAAPPSMEERLLSTLESWLSAIHHRRAHVR
ncbi:tetratricopeptide repeat protein [Geoalkalibacter halelectricus]|uniref:tetratricopeptide repeat protein n=1 Tax=Geoalkalibacter halelectricus TaxID=2847045 RepID=UPI003D219C99